MSYYRFYNSSNHRIIEIQHVGIDDIKLIPYLCTLPQAQIIVTRKSVDRCCLLTK